MFSNKLFLIILHLYFFFSCNIDKFRKILMVVFTLFLWTLILCYYYCHLCFVNNFRHNSYKAYFWSDVLKKKNMEQRFGSINLSIPKLNFKLKYFFCGNRCWLATLFGKTIIDRTMSIFFLPRHTLIFEKFHFSLIRLSLSIRQGNLNIL